MAPRTTSTKRGVERPGSGRAGAPASSMPTSHRPRWDAQMTALHAPSARIPRANGPFIVLPAEDADGRRIEREPRALRGGQPQVHSGQDAKDVAMPKQHRVATRGSATVDHAPHPLADLVGGLPARRGPVPDRPPRPICLDLL